MTAKGKNISWLVTPAATPSETVDSAVLEVPTATLNQIKNAELSLTQEQLLGLVTTLKANVRVPQTRSAGRLFSEMLPEIESTQKTAELRAKMEEKLLLLNSDVEVASSGRHGAELSMLRQMIDWLNCLNER